MAQFMASDFAVEKVKEACAQVDITGYNYAAARCEIDGKLFPNRILVGSGDQSAGFWTKTGNWSRNCHM